MVVGLKLGNDINPVLSKLFESERTDGRIRLSFELRISIGSYFFFLFRFLVTRYTLLDSRFSLLVAGIPFLVTRYSSLVLFLTKLHNSQFKRQLSYRSPAHFYKCTGKFADQHILFLSAQRILHGFTFYPHNEQFF